MIKKIFHKKIIQKKSDEIDSHKTWVRIYSVFTLLHIVVIGFFSYFFISIIENVDTPVSPTLVTNETLINQIESKITTIEAILSQKTTSLLQEVVTEENREVPSFESINIAQ